MKIRINFGHLLVAVLGVTVCLVSTMSAGERPKSTHTQVHRGGDVTGQITGTFANQVVYGAGETVTLTPLSGGQTITIRSDAEGRFLFAGVSPGAYDLKTQLNWTTTYIEECDDGTTERLYADHWEPLGASVQVKAGDTTHIISFSRGGTHNAFYAYGGTLSRPHHPLVNDD